MRPLTSARGVPPGHDCGADVEMVRAFITSARRALPGLFERSCHAFAALNRLEVATQQRSSLLAETERLLRDNEDLRVGLKCMVEKWAPLSIRRKHPDIADAMAEHAAGCLTDWRNAAPPKEQP